MLVGCTDPYRHVYCTNCIYFRIIYNKSDNSFLPYCKYDEVCKIENCEDSTPFYLRPYYRDNNKLKI